MADLKISVLRPDKDLTVIHLAGEFEGYNVLNNKEQLLDHVKHSASKELMVDFAEIEYIDSAAVGALLEMMRLSEKHKKGFGLLHVSDSVRKVLVVTKLDKILKIYE